MKRSTLAIFLILITACNDNDDEAFSGGSVEFKPKRTLPANFEENLSQKNPDEKKVVAAIDYDVSVTSMSKAKICDGTLLLSIYSDFTLKFTDSILSCGSMKLDLGAMLAGNKSEDDIKKKLESDGKVFKSSNIAGATFDPPRPLMQGPVVLDNKKFKGYEGFFKTQATVGSKKSRGEFAVRVLDHDAEYSNETVGESFDNIIHWQIEATGFDGLPATKGMLFKSLTWWYATRPIMIPKLKISGYLSEFLSSKDGKALDALTGELDIDLDVNNYKIK